MIFVISGPGGVGKGTVVARLLETVPRLWLSRSWTTRRRRPGEPTDAYVFATREDFEARVAAGGFVEWTEFAGNGQLYGTPTLEAPDGRDVVLEIELDGARQIKDRYPEAVLIFVVAPSRSHQEERLRGRGDDPDSVARRLAVSADEERLGRRLADHVVVNDEVDKVVAEVAGIISRYRNHPVA